MMRTPEGKVKDRIKKLLKEYNVYYVMPVTGGFGNSGAPDFLLCMKGKFVGVECKAGKNRMTKLQELNHEHILDSGGLFFLVNENTFDQFEALIKHTYEDSHGRGTDNQETTQPSDAGQERFDYKS